MSLVLAQGEVLHDGDLVEAILDRLLERGAHFAMRGRSYRTQHRHRRRAPRESRHRGDRHQDATKC